jgi:hypothetical protein
MFNTFQFNTTQFNSVLFLGGVAVKGIFGFVTEDSPRGFIIASDTPRAASALL